MSFLTAEWRQLAIANYAVDPSLLAPFVPAGTELDIWQGHCFVSLVGFMFKNTRLLGVKIPFHVDFEEVNLRFYVKRFDGREWKRGVVFLKEIVPKRALAWVANTVYGEHYETLPMRHRWTEQADSRLVEYAWRKRGAEHRLAVTASKAPSAIEPGSEAEFITEHYWGYTRVDGAKSHEYQVTHPRWDAYRVLGYEVEVDFGAVYGERFAFLNARPPHSVMLAEGSPITVEGKSTIRLLP